MKKIVPFLLIVLFSHSLTAKHVDSATANLAASRFAKYSMKINTAIINIAEVVKQQDTILYYVLNIGTNNGYVIVAATDASYPILVFSDKGKYQLTNQSPAFEVWMKGYKLQLLNIIRRDFKPTKEISQEWDKLLTESTLTDNLSETTTVGPLLTTTWDQTGYYNDLCPANCPTGCVATAMAQIMKYWNYPANGTDEECYIHPVYGEQCANFGETYYNWSSMPNYLNYANTAVATLMYHCGVSVHMDYGPDVSGAWVLTYDENGYHPYSAEIAYQTYFGYNSNTIQGVVRNDYTDTYWINSILKPEIDAQRPVQYVGYDGPYSGHTWVCDGYNTNNQFHMNWGWGGSGDNWCYMSDLHPNNSYYNFNDFQSALIGIEPAEINNNWCDNDDCNDAIYLTSNSNCDPLTCSVEFATADYFSVPSCDEYTPTNILGAGVFFKFEAESTSHTITVTPLGSLDAIIVVYNGSCYNLQEIPAGCVDAPGGNGVVTSLTVSNLVVGSEYTIRVYDYGSSNAISGDFEICITHGGGSSEDDFYVQNEAISSSVVSAGDEFEVSATQCYSGNTPDAEMGSVHLGYYLSQFSSFNIANSTLLSYDSSGLGEDDPCDDEIELVTIPSNTSPGNYYIHFVSDYDEEFPESNENNNVETLPITITAETSEDDFYNQNPTVSQSNILPGETVLVTVTQCYTGNKTDDEMGTVHLGYYISSSSTFNISDSELLNTDSSGLGIDDPCNSEEESIVIPAAYSPGVYYIHYVTDYDNLFVEFNENNNVASLQITLTTGQTDQDFYITNTNSNPYTVQPGSIINTSASQCYNGTTPDAELNSVQLGYFLSLTPAFDISNSVFLGSDESSLGSDDPCNDESENLMIPLDTDPGDYFLLFVTDYENQFVETNENNNVVAVPILITQNPSLDDFYILDIGIDIYTVAPGSGINVNATQCYTGDTPDSELDDVSLGYYLSTTPTFDLNAIYLSSDASSLGSDYPCNYESESIIIPIGTLPGNYYLLFFSDHLNAFTESDENNNILAASITVLNNDGDDFTVMNPSIEETTVVAGKTIDVIAEHCYTGPHSDAQLSDVSLGYFLSTTSSFNSSTSYFLGEDSSGLGNDDPCNAEFSTLTIPFSLIPGYYFVLFVSDYDNQFTEVFENNNVFPVMITVAVNTNTDDRPVNEPEFKVYPTITSDEVTIKHLTEYRSSYNIVFYNNLGQKIQSLEVNEINNDSFQLDVSSLPNGFYYIMLYNSKIKQTFKLIITD